MELRKQPGEDKLKENQNQNSKQNLIFSVRALPCYTILTKYSQNPFDIYSYDI